MPGSIKHCEYTLQGGSRPHMASVGYKHKSRVGDLIMWDNRQIMIMWDNRQIMHRARRFDRSEVRDMRRTTPAGDAPTIGRAP
jgi:alpha-ketoglutarate-dependent taurine dioxygenase